ncbi:hypothetical protein VIGAN_03160700 [Vigna angularis var. angularis]|uniref:Uncharacterized protein n=1 Tax=Vigna angularis var. angularis TaxID=157739 RepID=A0A0S3RMB0_PHAAN|nr:hypothetical protein VIGAN_03160700 [Vigna angularis var. angularis]
MAKRYISTRTILFPYHRLKRTFFPHHTTIRDINTQTIIFPHHTVEENHFPASHGRKGFTRQDIKCIPAAGVLSGANISSNQFDDFSVFVAEKDDTRELKPASLPSPSSSLVKQRANPFFTFICGGNSCLHHAQYHFTSSGSIIASPSSTTAPSSND